MGRTPHRARRCSRSLAAFALTVLTLACVSAASGKKPDWAGGEAVRHGQGHGGERGHGNSSDNGNGHESPLPPAPEPVPVAPAPPAAPTPALDAPQGNGNRGHGNAYGHSNGHGRGHRGALVAAPVTPPQEPAKQATAPDPAPAPSTPAPSTPAPQPSPTLPPAAPAPTGFTPPGPGPSPRSGSEQRPAGARAPRRSAPGSPTPLAARQPRLTAPASADPAPALATAPTGAEPKGDSDGARARGTGPGPDPQEAERSPIVRSFERIVEVIPLAVKAIILVLGVLLVLASVAWFLHARTARYLRRQREMLLEEVGVLQGALLPTVPAELSRLEASVAYRPAEGLAAGGDFYDAFALDDGRVGIVVGDVAGHGKDALMHTALLRYTLRAYLEADLEPRAALQVAGRALDRGFDTLATVVLAVYDPNARVLRYACAGHPPPVFLGDADHVPVTASSSPPIGAGLPTGLRQTTVCLPADSAVCFFTDGLIEARRGQQLIGRLGLVEIIRGLGPRATASELLDRVAAEADRVDDDMAACMFRVVDGPAETSASRVEELEVRRGEPLDVMLRRFLVTCGVDGRAISSAILRAQRSMQRHPGVVVQAMIRPHEVEVQVRPANVESFASAEARRDALSGARR
jgi:hypothetical protein